MKASLLAHNTGIVQKAYDDLQAALKQQGQHAQFALVEEPDGAYGLHTVTYTNRDRLIGSHGFVMILDRRTTLDWIQSEIDDSP